MDQFLLLFPQTLVNSIFAGSLYSLIALGLTLIYGIFKFVNFAHGDIAMTGAYLFFTFYVLLKLPLAVSVLFGVVSLILINLCIERITFRPVQKAPTLIPLIISVGVSFFLQALILLFFDAQSRSLETAGDPHVLFESIYITNVQIAMIIVNIILCISLFTFLKKTKVGKAIRAVSDNQEVAQILGINVNRVTTIVFSLAAIFAAAGGILAAFDQNMHPYFGIELGIKAFAAIILGGVGNLYGAVLGAFVIGFAENLLLIIPFIPSFETGSFNLTTMASVYKDAIAFFIIIIMLYFRPTGLLGAKAEEKIRKA